MHGAADLANAARALTPQVASTLSFIASCMTALPVPVVYGLPTPRRDNEMFARPYMRTSFLPGRSVVEDWWEEDDGSLRVIDSGRAVRHPRGVPCRALRTRATCRRQATRMNGKWPQRQVMDTVVSPHAAFGRGRRRVLGIPDFTARNVLVDRAGNLTGMSGWDLDQTAPLCVGFWRYMAWITRDWDPQIYGWHASIDREDSTGKIVGHRHIYEVAMTR